MLFLSQRASGEANAHAESNWDCAQWVRSYGVIVLAILFGARPAVAESVKEAKQLCTGNPDISWSTQVKSCTTLIQSGGDSGQNLAVHYYKRGIAYFNLGDFDKSIADNDQALRINPKYEDALVNRGASYARKGNIDRAVQDYDQAIRLDARDPIAFYNRGKARLDREQNDLAIQDFNDSLKLSPNNAIALNNRGVAFRNKGDYERAMQDYDLAIKLDDKYNAAYNNRCWARALSGHFQNALADCDMSLQAQAE